MAEYPLTVIGILRPTRSADDRAIFFSLASFWGMNEVARKMQVKPLTAVLLRARRMSDLPSLNRELNRSEEHTSELQSQSNLVCRLLLEKKKKTRANERSARQ